MTLERRNPLPVGIYWADIFEPDMPAFREWLTKNKKDVGVIRTQSFGRIAKSGLTTETWKAHDWYLFQVIEPVHWEGPGFPDIAESKELTAEETVQRPPPARGPIETLEETIIEAPEAAAKIVTGAVVIGGVGLALYFLATRKGK